jgi:hypothetical protein
MPVSFLRRGEKWNGGKIGAIVLSRRCSSSVIGHFFGQFLRGVACPSDLPMIIVGLPTMLPHHLRGNQSAYQ